MRGACDFMEHSTRFAGRIAPCRGGLACVGGWQRSLLCWARSRSRWRGRSRCGRRSRKVAAIRRRRFATTFPSRRRRRPTPGPPAHASSGVRSRLRWASGQCPRRRRSMRSCTAASRATDTRWIACSSKASRGTSSRAASIAPPDARASCLPCCCRTDTGTTGASMRPPWRTCGRRSSPARNASKSAAAIRCRPRRSSWRGWAWCRSSSTSRATPTACRFRLASRTASPMAGRKTRPLRQGCSSRQTQSRAWNRSWACSRGTRDARSTSWRRCPTWIRRAWR